MPLGGGRHNPFDNEMVKIAAAHRKNRRTGSSALECTARRCSHSEIGSGENRREFPDMGFYTDAEERCRKSVHWILAIRNCGQHFDPEFVKMCNTERSTNKTGRFGFNCCKIIFAQCVPGSRIF